VNAKQFSVADALASRWAPIVAGAVTAMLIYWFWGGLSLPGAIHDERAYLVGARLLAEGSFSAPTPPLPMFWEMAHVFVEPALFSKYPPGHSIVLVPGVWLGIEGLVPVLLAGLCGGLVFALARRLAGSTVAVLTWSIWTLAPQALAWHSTYFSQTSTAVLWLIAITALVAWRERESPWLLLTIVASIAWMGITRPFTGVALMIPIGIVVVWTAYQRRSLDGWKRSAVVGALICAIVPYWAWSTIGDPTTLPYIEYSRIYFPFDLPGFVRDTSASLRPLPPDLDALGRAVSRIYENHTADRVPVAFLERLGPALTDPLGVFAPLLALGVIGAVATGWRITAFVAASFLLLLGVHLVMPQPLGWTIYSLELFAVTPFLVAVGFVRTVTWLREYVLKRGNPRPLIPRAELATGLLLAGLVFAAMPEIRTKRVVHNLRSVRQQLARQLIAELPEERVVVFVRRDFPTSPHFTLWDIGGPSESTPVWVVRDLGDARNRELIALADGRRPYLLDEDSMTLSPIAAPTP
jgi:4-amino-4-deoxy-L-arabinose transferase-like glycosyltransferase